MNAPSHILEENSLLEMIMSLIAWYREKKVCVLGGGGWGEWALFFGLK